MAVALVAKRNEIKIPSIAFVLGGSRGFGSLWRNLVESGNSGRATKPNSKSLVQKYANGANTLSTGTG